MKFRRFFACLAVALWPAAAWCAPSSLVRAQQDYVPDEVLVIPSTGVGAAQASASAGGWHVMQAVRGATPFLRLKLRPGQTVQAAMSALSRQPWVANVEPNYIYHATALPNDTRFAEQWGLKNTGQTVNGQAGTAGADISAVNAWSENTNCASITVAVIDTGVDYNHPELTSAIWTNAGETPNNGVDDDGNGYIDDVNGWDFVQGDNTPMDFNEHGTHVAGIIGAAGSNAAGVTGVCWTAKIMPLRVLNSAGSGTTADIVAAIDYARLNGAKVINMSLGGPGFSTLMDQAIANAAGVLVIAAAGNSGTDNDVTPEYPASYAQPNIIAVAATDQNDALATFSNFGPTSVDVGAPGTNILSTVPPARTPVCSWNFDAGTLQGWAPQTLDNTTGLPVANTVAVTTESAMSPLYSLTDTPGATYANNRSYRATSPACDLTGQQGAVLEYALNMNTESLFDYLYIEYSSNGAVWTNPFGVGVGLSGTTGGWLRSGSFGGDADLQPLDGVATAQVRFRLETDATNVFDGFHVDDVAITVPNTAPAAHSTNDYAFLDGTSMATPLVTGVVALVWAADPTLTHLQVRDRVLNNGDAIPALAGKTVTGRRINAQMAMPLHAATAVTANAVSSSRVDLAWTDNSVSEQNYLVQRSAGGAFATIATLAANTTAYSDTAAPASTALSYRIVAQARDGRTMNSATANVTTPAAPPPPAGGGGGGCVMRPGAGGFDPLLPALAAGAWLLGWLRRSRPKRET